MAAAEAPRTYNIALFGDSGVGKTAYIHRLLTGNFIRSWNPTYRTISYPSYEHTTRGGDRFICNLIDTNGGNWPRQVKCDELDAAIIMFDVTSKVSYNNVETWYNAIREEHPDIPIVIVGNKVDVSADSRTVRRDDIVFHRGHNLSYYDVSTKACFNWDKPINMLTQLLTKKHTE